MSTLHRFELRHVVTDAIAERVREIVSNHVPLDEFSVGLSGHSYPVRTLHLNSDPPCIYWQDTRLPKNHYELRLRRYNDHPDSFVFLEIKRFINNVVLKQRTCVRQAAVPRLLAGSSLGLEDLPDPDPKSTTAVENFRRLLARTGAQSRIQIEFDREAYFSSDNNVRVTMDRNTRWEPNELPRFKAKLNDPVCSLKGLVVLILRFTDRFPDWLRGVTCLAENGRPPV